MRLTATIRGGASDGEVISKVVCWASSAIESLYACRSPKPRIWRPRGTNCYSGRIIQLILAALIRRRAVIFGTAMMSVEHGS